MRQSLLSLHRLLCLVCFVAASGVMGVVQAQNPAPTLVPPTLIPTPVVPEDDNLLAESGVVRLQQTGMVRVGVLYNEPPFVELTIRGEVSGYEADVVRAMAEVWGVDIEFVQVTRQNAISYLQDGTVDMLAAAMVHRRALDDEVEFSQTYHAGKQAMLVLADASIASVYNMSGQAVGYVLGTPAEQALNTFIAETNLNLQLKPYLTLDRAYAALYGGEISGVVGRRERLLRVAQNELEAVSILSDVITPESFAIAVPRQDMPMRNLINRTLQYLLQDRDNLNAASTLERLYEDYFPAVDFAYDALPVWANAGDAPDLSQFTGELVFPQTYSIPRIQSEGVLRVAGLRDVPVDAPQSVARVLQINRSIAEQLASRWGVSIQVVLGDDPIALVESGQADFAVGIEPDWNLAARVDFSQPYLKHGDRLMVPAQENIQSFADLRGAIVGVIGSDGNGAERAEAWADSINRPIRIFQTSEADVALTLLENNNADVVFGDSLMLVPHVQMNPADLELTERWYSRDYLSFALPRNDLDFRRLVDYTLQEMAQDDTLNTMLRPVTPPDENLLRLDIWSGESSWFGFNTGS